MSYPFETLLPELAQRWTAMRIDPAVKPAAMQVAKRLLMHMDRYQAVSKATGVPAAVIACIHEREASGRFDTYLGNGDPLNQPTTHVPAGRGPFATWEDGAIDALRLDNLHVVNGWTLEKAAYEFELYNGFGYRNHGVASAYVWAGSNQYTGGKFIKDGVFDPNAKDQQIGCMVLIECLTELDPTLALPRDTREPAKSAQPAPLAPIADQLNVMSLQIKLKALGLYSGALDNDRGAKTNAALEDFAIIQLTKEGN